MSEQKTQLSNCPECNIQRVPALKPFSPIATEIMAGIIFLAGLGVLLLENITGGAIMIALSFILSTINKQYKTVMACPNCGKHGIEL